MSEVIRQTAEGSTFLFFCRGCQECHWFKTSAPEPTWGFNNDLQKPTVSPSILVRGEDANGPMCCHSYIREGQIQFLGDCTHVLAGKTVALEPW